ncbi:AMP-binding enzyme [Actinomyces denticolens]|uniref:AMP-binding protein n=1 Tax=Actinomyces denticolens TaxID=52767 RepID=UPI0009CCA3DE|nr:AMP-binding protein [Actinomyces denticolens]GAV94738.1 AMP-binding enzyme [Actinomyces denticolens]
MSTRPAPLLLRGGTSPDAVAGLRAALASLLDRDTTGPGPSAVAIEGSAASYPLLVPISPQEDEALVRADLARRLDPAGPASRADILLRTSGSTTGTGSLIAMSAPALVASARATHARLSGPGTWVLALPAHHVAGLQVLVRSLVAGTEPVVVDTTGGFRATALTGGLAGALATSSRPVYLSLVPTQLLRALADPDCARALARTSAVLLGGAAADPVLLARARSAGVPVVTTYGMSETGGGCVYDGAPLDGVTVTIEEPDATGAGRIALAGPVLALGYAHRTLPGDPAPASRFAARDGRPLLLTSDRGRLDGDGRLIVLGRLDDVIISGGIKVDPREVEAALLRIPGVGEACVVGIPDTRWGSAVAAAVVPAPSWDDGGLDAQSLRSAARAALPGPRRPSASSSCPNCPSEASASPTGAPSPSSWPAPAGRRPPEQATDPDQQAGPGRSPPAGSPRAARPPWERTAARDRL